MSRLLEIIHYQEMARRAGHSQTTLNIAKASGPGSVVVVANKNEVVRLSRQFPEIEFLTPDSLSRLYGRYAPLFIDHYALAQLVTDHDQDWRRMFNEVLRKAEQQPTTEGKS
jgi:hypothetical protein